MTSWRPGCHRRPIGAHVLGRPVSAADPAGSASTARFGAVKATPTSEVHTMCKLALAALLLALPAELARRTGAQVIGAYELVGLIGAEKGNGANAGGTVQVKDVKIHLVPAVHSSGFGSDPKATPQYGGTPLGFVLEIQGGPTLYHAGDTDVFQDMALIAERYRPTVAMLPIGGHFTMDPEGAALAARLLRVKTVIPMHFGTFPALAGTPDQLSAALKKSGATAKVLAFKPGETKEL